jgi:hypothetical protein
MQTISRLYANEENARKAWDELKRRGYADSYIFTPPARGTEETSVSASAASVAEVMVKAFIVRSEAVIYARRVTEGASLVTVHAPFSGGLKATTILDRQGPIDSGVSEPTTPSFAWDETVPFSSAFRMPLLTQCAHPFEAISGLPSLIKFKYASRARSIPVNSTPFSTALGLPLLLQNPVPISSFLSIPVLMKSRPLFYR